MMIFAHPVPGNDRARVIPFCRRLISSYTPPVHRCPQVCNIWLDWMRPKVLCSLKFTCEQTLRHPPSSQSLSESSTQPSCYGTVPSEYGTTLGCIREHSEKSVSQYSTLPLLLLTTSVARQQPQLGNRCKFFASMYTAHDIRCQSCIYFELTARANERETIGSADGLVEVSWVRVEEHIIY